jgi:hypothetical protein
MRREKVGERGRKRREGAEKKKERAERETERKIAKRKKRRNRKREGKKVCVCILTFIRRQLSRHLVSFSLPLLASPLTLLSPLAGRS